MRELVVIDKTVGQNLAKYRRECGLSEIALAARVGIRESLLIKYESGEERIPASRLFDLAAELDLKVTAFFVGLFDECR